MKWPLLFMAKGMTARVEQTQLGDVGERWKARSTSGWMASGTLADYLCN
jgi:hypothetical protein